MNIVVFVSSEVGEPWEFFYAWFYDVERVYKARLCQTGFLDLLEFRLR